MSDTYIKESLETFEHDYNEIMPVPCDTTTKDEVYEELIQLDAFVNMHQNYIKKFFIVLSFPKFLYAQPLYTWINNNEKHFAKKWGGQTKHVWAIFDTKEEALHEVKNLINKGLSSDCIEVIC